MTHSTLILRLAGPAQTWAGYRVRHNDIPTHPQPTKSGVAGLLGAITGHRNYLDLIDTFDLTIRVDRSNPVITDLQTATPTKPREKAPLTRVAKLTSLGKVTPKKQLTGTDQPGLTNRDVLAHTEFIAAITAHTDTITTWAHHLRRPVWMPYLGRHCQAPTFPFNLGHTHTHDTDWVLNQLPRVAPQDTPTGEPVRAYTITGTYTHHRADTTNRAYTPPTTDRRTQLNWAKEHLQR